MNNFGPTAKRYMYPKEVWDAKKCERLANATQTDGLGTPYGFKGYVGNIVPTSVDYNGGTSINGDWYQGVIYLRPHLAEGYEFVIVPTWGLRIVKKGGD
jgi:hypothetical protein